MFDETPELDPQDVLEATDVMDKICLAAHNTGKWDKNEAMLAVKVSGIWMLVLPTNMSLEDVNIGLNTAVKHIMRISRPAAS